MILSKLSSAVVLLFLILSGCSSAKQQKNEPHKVSFYNGSSGNKLEVLDWGGKGRPMIFLTGLGNSAHVFDEFAPRFTDEFRVYGLTRRGFGASAPAKEYDLKALTADLVAIMDSLGIEKAILAGHSVAGEEISKFSVLYPNRVERVIYLDAAYDRMGMDTLYTDMPEVPRPTKNDSASFENLQKFYKSNYGIRVPDEEIRQTSIFSSDGRYVRDVTADSIIGAVIAGTEHPDYLKIESPALAIYAKHDSVQQGFPFYSTMDSINQQKAMRVFTKFQKLIVTQQTRFKNEVKNGVVKDLMGANHYVFISHPNETEKLMREFLQ